MNCRACLSTENTMIRMDDDFVYNYNMLTNLNVKTTDSLCQFVCETCLHAVKFFLEFRDKCILSEETLRSTYKTVKCENDESVKKEYEVDAIDETFLDAFDFNDNSNVDVKDNEEFENIKDNDVDIKAEYDGPPEITTSISNLRPKRKCVKTGVRKLKKNKQSRGNIKKLQKRLQTDGLVNITQKIVQSCVKIKKLYKHLQTCGLCPMEFEDKSALSEHLEDHKTSMNCELCNKSFDDWPIILSHRLEHMHGRHKYCHLCPKRFTCVQNYEVHLRRHHFDQKHFRLHCSLCSKTYETRRKLKKHISTAHTSKTYVCDICNKVCTTRNSIKIHLISHSDIKRYPCKLCDFSCKLKTGLKQHTIRKHIPGRIICKNCREAFANQKHYDMHKCKHRSVQICPVCGEQLRGSVRLKTHMQKHVEVGKHKCPLCPKTYKAKGALRAHMDRHDNNPRNQCEFCPAKFYSASVLVKHRRTHTGEKPYVCPICQKGFTGNNNLKVHMKVHGIHNLIIKRIKPDEIPDEA